MQNVGIAFSCAVDFFDYYFWYMNRLLVALTVSAPGSVVRAGCEGDRKGS
jgi:hypothetical protein